MAADPQRVASFDNALAAVRAVVMGARSSYAHGDVNELIGAYEAIIAELEQELWARGCEAALLERYQAAHRQMERLISERGDDTRHRFIVVISVADRPQLLRRCLDSLATLCELYHYGGRRDARYPKLTALVVDDSRENANRAEHKMLAEACTERGIEALYCDPDAQAAWLAALPAPPGELARILGDRPRREFYHKGSSVMRNISYLKLRELWRETDEPMLFHFIDCDQEFRIKTATPAGDRDLYALPYFHALDRIFTERDALVVTGKVVGDPPVSPAVMTSTFLDDVIAFLERLAAMPPHARCEFHRTDGAGEERGAIYHDMAERFGFAATRTPLDYTCRLDGVHDNGDCLRQFAGSVGRFFFGEHPTRKTRYTYQGVGGGLAPARTVYAGNYVLRPQGLRYFIPFADLRLRMPGPTLGRILKAELGEGFISANLPMLHQRTAGEGSDQEFRPGIDCSAEAVDISGEFVRQFYGDVMLFTVERLTAGGPLAALPSAVIGDELEATRAELLTSYNRRQRTIGEKLSQVGSRLDAPNTWWNREPAFEPALRQLRTFVANVARNFGERAPAYQVINDPADWSRRRLRMAEAIAAYTDDRAAWEAALFGR